MDSILLSIKKMLGIEAEDISFDTDVIIHINSVIMVLAQLGIGPSDFSVTDDSETWSQYLGLTPNLYAVKTYIYLKVRLAFDPPGTSYLLESISRQVTELEWRLNVQAEAGSPS